MSCGAGSCDCEDRCGVCGHLLSEHDCPNCAHCPGYPHDYGCPDE